LTWTSLPFADITFTFVILVARNNIIIPDDSNLKFGLVVGLELAIVDNFVDQIVNVSSQILVR
jgi:hypothetical protein